MKEKMGTIGHVSHVASSTMLTAAIMNILKDNNNTDVIIIDKDKNTVEGKTFDQLIEEDNVIQFKIRPSISYLEVVEYTPEYKPKKQQQYKPYKNKFTKGKR